MSLSAQSCSACETLHDPAMPGWWSTTTVLVCPRCLPLLSIEDHEELGSTFAPLMRRHSE